MNNIQLKVCGLTRWEDMNQLAGLGVPFGGMIFYEKSPRFVGNKLDPQQIKEFKGLKKVGVFVNAKVDDILSKVNAYGLDLVQLHGDESPEFCAEIRKHLPVIKAFRLNTPDDLLLLETYVSVCDYFLFDTPGLLYGGSGDTFNWNLLSHYKENLPFFLSGGIGLNESEQLKDFSHPQWYSIDVNSRFEISPGVKNIADIKRLLWHLNIG